MKTFLTILIAISSLTVNSCVVDTVDSLSEFTFQIPVNFGADYLDRTSPDTSFDFSHLLKYDAYRENKDKISEALVYQLNYRIDSLVLEDGVPFGPGCNDLVFESIAYKLQFGKSLFGNTNSTNPNEYIPDPDSPIYELGEFVNVSVREFYRRSDHILEVPGSTASVISETLKRKPYFYIITEYSKIVGQTEETVSFPFINSKFDVIIRLKVKL
jgi:hypothetical protein